MASKTSLPTPNAGPMQNAPGFSTRTRKRQPSVPSVGKVATTSGFKEYADVPGTAKGAAKEGSKANNRRST